MRRSGTRSIWLRSWAPCSFLCVRFPVFVRSASGSTPGWRRTGDSSAAGSTGIESKGRFYMIVYMATLRTRPETADQVGDALRQLAGQTLTEPGCLSYTVHRGLEDSTL